MELHPYETFDDLCMLAKKVERQQEPKARDSAVMAPKVEVAKVGDATPKSNFEDAS